MIYFIGLFVTKIYSAWFTDSQNDRTSQRRANDTREINDEEDLRR